MTATDFSGTVAPGFEPVAQQLRALIADGEERGGAVAVYRDGRPVVDIWAGMAEGAPWQEDTLAVTFSTTKGVAALCVMMLHDRGVLDVDAPVSKYWPEYAANGKGATLVRHVLTHTAAQHTFPNYWDVIGSDYKGIDDHEQIANRLAESPPAWEPGTKEMYHALTYGFLVEEIVRRTDGRSLSQFYRDEIAEPLGLELWIGLPGELTERVTFPRADALPTGRRLAYRRKYVDAGRAALRKNGAFDPLAWPYAILLAHPDIDDPLELATITHQPWFPGAQLPAANGIGTARALAKMYAVLSLGGEMDGVRLVSEDAIRRFSTVAETSKTAGLGFFVAPPSTQALGAGKGTFGSGGAGGTIAFADPANRMSIAFTKNQMRDQSMASARLILALYRSLGGASRSTRIRQSAIGAVVNHRRVINAAVSGVGWLQSFRSIEKANPLNRD